MKQIAWFRTVMKIWIALTSVIAFLGGWILFGHSGKPVAAAVVDAASIDAGAGGGADLAPLPALAPIPSFDNQPGENGSGPSIQPMPAAPSIQFARPRMRTRGS